VEFAKCIEREPQEWLGGPATPTRNSPSDILCVRGSFADDPHFSVCSPAGCSAEKWAVVVFDNKTTGLIAADSKGDSMFNFGAG
jgi:hypothetical protein